MVTQLHLRYLHWEKWWQTEHWWQTEKSCELDYGVISLVPHL